MKILFLTPYLPSPPRFGGARRLHGLISGLARSHSVSVLSLMSPEDHSNSIRATSEYCDEVVTILNDRYALGNAAKRKLQLKSMLSTHSYERMIYHRPAMQHALDRMVSRTSYDIINVEFSQMAYYRFPGTTRLVLDEHNIEYDVLYRTFSASSGLARKTYNYIDYVKLRREERKLWRRFDGCSVTSARDQQIMQHNHPRLRTVVVPNGVDTNYFHPEGSSTERMTIAFFGALNYYPNLHGLLFFLRDVMPQLKQRYPKLKLYIIGPSPPDEILAWASEDVVITGFVDDVRPYLQRARAIIVPLHIGGGTRLKVVEAMAMGKALVSTSIGAEGIDVTHGHDILLADTAESFAFQLSRVLDDEALTLKLGTEARALAERSYDWQSSVRKLESLYEQLITLQPEPRDLLYSSSAR